MRRPIVAGLIVAIAVISAVLGYEMQKPSSSDSSQSSKSSQPFAAGPFSKPESPPSTASPPLGVPPGGRKRADRRGTAGGEAGGALPDRVTVFDDRYAGVAKLDPGLLQALRKAASDAARDGVELHVNSGWRSAEHQQQLLREAISKYGSEKEAARWVATPDTSPHVSGDAVDLGGSDATTWLSRHGAHYGLCQIYRNEPWHYELRANAIDHGCPPMYADPTKDPRMRR